MKLHIKGGTVVDPYNDSVEERDLYIENGVFVNTLTGDPDRVIDAVGKTIFPGLIDSHVHLRDPGYEYREDIITGTKAAARGGFTRVACMPNTRPICDSPAIVSYIIDKAERQGYCQVLPVGAVSKNEEGEELAEIGLMVEAGAVGISDDGVPVKTAELMRKAMVYADYFDIVVMDHCEDKTLTKGGSMNEGKVSLEMGLMGVPSAAEEIMMARDILLAEYLDLPVHLSHCSTANGIELVREAKRRGVKVTCETCPHYFWLTDEAVRGYRTEAKMYPPLRTEKDRVAMIEGLLDGTIDMIATDHAPHHIDEKDMEFSLANPGIVGLETSFPLSYTKLVKEHGMDLLTLAKKMASEAAKLLRQPLDGFKEGARADLMMADLNKPFTVDKNTFATKGRNTPFDGYELYGRPELTIWKGRITHEELS